ncbi:MAG: hypothetical protein R3320_13845, partial [Nitriliruptorales bacterium]|nr:hypothetical protein [Nitriliruptorales bacterium]
MSGTPSDILDLLDYRRRVADLYHDVRVQGADRGAWERWRAGRDELFGTHPRSALPVELAVTRLDEEAPVDAAHVEAGRAPIGAAGV